MIKNFKPVGMTENRFWELVKLAKWPKQSYEDSRIMYRKLLSKQECIDFRDSVDLAFGILDNVADRSISGVGDDGYGDLLHHVIGLGKKTFYDCANHVWKIQKMADKGKYKESFAYCIPYEEDYNKNSGYTINSVVYIAKAAIKEIERFRAMDSAIVVNDVSCFKWLADIGDEIDKTEIILLNFLDFALKAPQDSLSTLIKTKGWVLKACAKIDKFFEDSYMELPRKFTEPDEDGNDFHGMCTALIENTIDDAEKVLKFLTTHKE